jgi:hypothetical protein
MTIHLNSAEATKMFPNVKGEIRSADLHSGYAVLDMGVGAYAVVCTAQFVACCPDYGSAMKAGEKAANAAMGIKTYHVTVKTVDGRLSGGGFTIVSSETKREIKDRYTKQMRSILAIGEFFDVREVREPV